MGREPVSDGVEHLQRAAHELIAAARSFLDAAEELVDDREVMAEATGALRSLARDLGRVRPGAGQPFGGQHGAPGDADAEGYTDGDAADAPGGGRTPGHEGPRVRRIHVE